MSATSSRRKRLLWAGAGAAGLFGAVGAAWLLSLPRAKDQAAGPPISRDETDALLAALKPPKRKRPVIAVIGINDATETTDYLMPYGMLRRGNVADVSLVAMNAGPVKLFPALTVESDMTAAEFDRQHPDGADYVIVPAMSRDDDPSVLAWIKAQARSGATVIGVCAGAKVVAAAGLLDGKRATTHWYYVKELRDKHPAVAYIRDRRLIADGRVATTTGITASMPMALTLVEAISGRYAAAAVGRDVGLPRWDLRHNTDAFQFTRPFAVTAMRNTAAFWNRERLGLDLTPGVDEVSLALVADAWSRTYRSRTVTIAASADAVVTRSGVRIVPDEAATAWPDERRLPIVDQRPADALEQALQGIQKRYGVSTAYFVAMQLEYPRPARDVKT